MMTGIRPKHGLLQRKNNIRKRGRIWRKERNKAPALGRY